PGGGGAQRGDEPELQLSGLRGVSRSAARVQRSDRGDSAERTNAGGTRWSGDPRGRRGGIADRKAGSAADDRHDGNGDDAGGQRELLAAAVSERSGDSGQDGAIEWGGVHGDGGGSP